MCSETSSFDMKEEDNRKRRKVSEETKEDSLKVDTKTKSRRSVHKVNPPEFIQIEFTVNRKKRMQKFKVCVPLKDSMKNGNPFFKKLDSFSATSTVLSFFGTRSQVCRLMQLLCH